MFLLGTATCPTNRSQELNSAVFLLVTATCPANRSQELNSAVFLLVIAKLFRPIEVRR